MHLNNDLSKQQNRENKGPATKVSAIFAIKWYKQHSFYGNYGEKNFSRHLGKESTTQGMILKFLDNELDNLAQQVWRSAGSSNYSYGT